MEAEPSILVSVLCSSSAFQVFLASREQTSLLPMREPSLRTHKVHFPPLCQHRHYLHNLLSAFTHLIWDHRYSYFGDDSCPTEVALQYLGGSPQVLKSEDQKETYLRKTVALSSLFVQHGSCGHHLHMFHCLTSTQSLKLLHKKMQAVNDWSVS